MLYKSSLIHKTPLIDYWSSSLTHRTSVQEAHILKYNLNFPSDFRSYVEVMTAFGVGFSAGQEVRFNFILLHRDIQSYSYHLLKIIFLFNV